LTHLGIESQPNIGHFDRLELLFLSLNPLEIPYTDNYFPKIERKSLTFLFIFRIFSRFRTTLSIGLFQISVCNIRRKPNTSQAVYFFVK
jgi:hypothetical protein